MVISLRFRGKPRRRRALGTVDFFIFFFFLCFFYYFFFIFFSGTLVQRFTLSSRQYRQANGCKTDEETLHRGNVSATLYRPLIDTSGCLIVNRNPLNKLIRAASLYEEGRSAFTTARIATPHFFTVQPLRPVFLPSFSRIERNHTAVDLRKVVRSILQCSSAFDTSVFLFWFIQSNKIYNDL